MSPLLDDLDFFFDDHDHAKPYDEVTGTGDPAISCRTQAAVLITDGSPNLGEGSFGYPHSHEAAAELFARGVKVYVVTLQPPPGSSFSFKKIASAGGTWPATVVFDSGELDAALEAIMAEVLAD